MSVEAVGLWMLNGMLICLQAIVSHLNTVPSSLSHLSLVQRRLLQQLRYVHVCHLLVRRPVRMQGPERRHRGPLRGELLRLHRVKVNVERGQSQLDLGLGGYMCNLKEGRQGAHVALLRRPSRGERAQGGHPWRWYHCPGSLGGQGQPSAGAAVAVRYDWGGKQKSEPLEDKQV